ncbi:hypothetical protein A2803_00915 [Candidatus Woesebacteria bacterium RIFCSPHIGHO2_01_FULL_44_21]|uniref:AbiEi antitoxin C-terminal domain-containing protein n=1 Tax=Candidatus Woesebacteria bacterium RIFCSPHIGHO2_01_FULL_44_21 TaxID=1802503 RepID=A0A1F7YY36_9BACT|nr:MAG: hypothetical protein A2803_00915 [Candidatus Woesebacteria bacterium RIFCSPHIGHO2_01_FULL_44_21]OGM69695.1 MAG: hypothetical protein A2897_00105 [Candidatus Woesebacteria bacterium RIFCSPLOWO2_01_FULL_44_24b]
MNNNFIAKLYSRPETVFTVDEVSQLFSGVSPESINDRLYYFTKTGRLKRLTQGVYAKLEYEPLELANKLYRPSYISLETVLAREGIIFQYYETIFAISYLTRKVVINGQEIQYRRIKESVLTNIESIEKRSGYFVATAERAFLDALYVYKDYHFDNLKPLNWEKVNSLKEIYKSKVLEKRLKDYAEY